MQRKHEQDVHQDKRLRLPSGVIHATLSFRFLDEKSSTFTAVPLEKYLSTKLTKRTKWNGNITILDNLGLFVYNVYTRKKEFQFNLDNTPTTPRYTPKVFQLANKNFLIFQTDFIYTCGPNGEYIEKIVHNSSNYNINLIELPHQRVIFTLRETLYEYNMREKAIQTRIGNIYFRIQNLSNNTFITRQIGSLELCVRDYSFNTLKTIKLDDRVVDYMEYDPSSLLCVSANDVLGIVDLTTGKMTSYKSLSPKYCTETLSTSTRKFILMCRNEIVVLSDTDEQRFECGDAKFLEELGYEIVGYTCPGVFIVLDVITGKATTHKLPKGTTLVAYVRDLE
jgi:hypothetical protein